MDSLFLPVSLICLFQQNVFIISMIGERIFPKKKSTILIIIGFTNT